MNSYNCLLVRNLRGNWSLRLIYEYKMRNIQNNKFSYIDLTNLEYFPPSKSAPTLISSTIREKIISKIFFIHPLPKHLADEIKIESEIYSKNKFNIFYLKPLIQLLAIKNSDELKNYYFMEVPFGKFLHTPLIAKIGIKHFSVNLFQRIKLIKLVYRFIVSFYTIDRILQSKNYTQIVLINGRDVIGAGAQLSAFVNNVNVICLEEALVKSDVPKFGQWNGNMHHWKIRKKALDSAIREFGSTYNLKNSQTYFENNFGLNSKFWKQSIPTDPAKELTKSEYVCFFTSSEKETSTFPTGNIEANEFDNSDQVSCLKMTHEITQKLGLNLIIRMHPNFSGTKIANMELKFFKKLTRNWANTILITNTDHTDSYKLARKAKFNLIFRSTLGLEFSFRNISVYHLAPTFWSEYANSKFISTKQEMLEIFTVKKIDVYQKSVNSDYHVFALYNTFQGEIFKHLNFVKNEKILKSKHFDKQMTLLNGLELDKPRFKFFSWRG